MRLPRFALVPTVFALFAQFASAQQTTSSSPQALALLQKSLAALQGNTSISDVTLSGSARRIAGSDDETGTATIKVLAGSGSRIDLNLPSGTRSELRNTSSTPPAGSWSGPDGVSHAISNHNLFTDPGWFPAFALSSLLTAANAVITYVGPETHNGQSVIHITASQQFPAISGNAASLMQHLTQTDIFLDPNTNLPVALALSTHPDNDAGLDLPVEIRFSDYRPVAPASLPASSAQIPFHVQKFLNNSVILDLQFQTATLNSGLSARRVAHRPRADGAETDGVPHPSLSRVRVLTFPVISPDQSEAILLLAFRNDSNCSTANPSDDGPIFAPRDSGACNSISPTTSFHSTH